MGGGGLLNQQTKSVVRDESYLLTVPYLVVFQRVIVGCWVVGVLLFTKLFLQVNLSSFSSINTLLILIGWAVKDPLNFFPSLISLESQSSLLII